MRNYEFNHRYLVVCLDPEEKIEFRSPTKVYTATLDQPFFFLINRHIRHYRDPITEVLVIEFTPDETVMKTNWIQDEVEYLIKEILDTFIFFNTEEDIANYEKNKLNATFDIYASGHQLMALQRLIEQGTVREEDRASRGLSF